MNRPGVVSVAEISGFLFLPLIILIRVLFGEDIYNLLFLIAEDIFYLAEFLRKINILSAVLLMVLLIASLVLYIKIIPQLNPELILKIRVILGIGLGITLSLFVIYWILDLSYFRGVFMTVPYLGGILLTIITLGFYYTDENIRQDIQYDPPMFNLHKYQIIRLLKLLSLLIFGLILIISNISYAGFLASPPDNDPAYGGKERPYEVNRIELIFTPPESIAYYITPINQDKSFSSYVYYPVIKGSSPNPPKNLPLVVFLHGIGAYDLDAYYTKIMEILASRGAIAIFVQYPDQVDLTGPYVETPQSNNEYNPAYYLRYQSLWHGLNLTINSLKDQSLPDQDNINSATQNISIDYNHTLLVGHSYGGGAVPYIASKLKENGIGTELLLLDMEAPWFAGRWDGLETNYSLMDATTLVTINTFQDDFRFDMCVPFYNFERLVSQSKIPAGQLQFTITPSDRYGFPRLVATHYAPADPLVDPLTYYGVFKRIDAMIVYLHAVSQNDVELQDKSLQYFLGGTSEMLNMGEWSDGTPVKPMYFSLDPSGASQGPDLTQYLTNYHKNYCETFA